MTAERSTLVDTNVLLDVLTDDPRWGAWSSDALAAAIDRGPILINQLILAEVSVRFAAASDVDAALAPLALTRESIPFDAGFPAAQAFARYRQRGESRSAVLPDFYIGAHALVRGHTLLTRDARRYRTSFPRLELTAPPPSSSDE